MPVAMQHGQTEGPVVICADLKRPYLFLPMLLLGTGAGIAFVVCVAALAGAFHKPGIGAGAARATLLCLVPFSYIRWIYAARSVLVLDDQGLHMTQPFAKWSVRWEDITLVQTTSAWDVTHRGGIAAGVRISVRDASSRHIPDVLSIRRRELAAMIGARRKRG